MLVPSTIHNSPTQQERIASVEAELLNSPGQIIGNQLAQRSSAKADTETHSGLRSNGISYGLRS